MIGVSVVIADLEPQAGTITDVHGNFRLDGCLVEDVPLLQTPGENNMSTDIIQDFDKSNYLLNIGINHIYIFNERSAVKTTLSYSATGMDDGVYESQIVEKDYNQEGILIDTLDRILNYKSRLKKSVYKGTVTYRNKINARNILQIGSKYSLFIYNNNQSILKGDEATRVTLTDFKGNIGTLRNFISWKYRLHERITIVAGIHNMNVLFNNKSTFEPRLAAKWKLSNSNAVHVGYGNHSNMERIHNYFAKVEQADGSIIESNRDLDLLKAHHLVLGYEKSITENLVAKIELYYQYLYNLPVENNDTSYYATINEGLDYRYVDLVNKGVV
jgi:hypothetical protein